MNAEDFVTYEQALALKKLGFNEETFTYYDENNPKIKGLDDFYEYHLIDYNRYSISVPTLAQAQKWLNKTKDFKLFVIPSPSDKVPYSYVAFNTTKTIYKNPPRYYSSYEEALSDGITECLKLLENKVQNS